MKELSAINIAFQTFEIFFFDNLPALGNEDPKRLVQHWQHKQSILIETLLACLAKVSDLQSAHIFIAKEYHDVVTRIVRKLFPRLSLSELSATIEYLNQPHALKIIFEFVPSEIAHRKGLQLFRKGSPPKLPAAAVIPVFLWPAGYSDYAKVGSFETNDKVLRQLLAHQEQYSDQDMFIHALVKEQLGQPFPDNYHYQLLGYTESHIYKDFDDMKNFICGVIQDAFSDIDCSLRLLPYFARHRGFDSAIQVNQLYQEVIRNDNPIKCSQLIAAIKTDEEASFVYDQIWTNTESLQDNDKLIAFLSSEKLMALLIKQISDTKSSPEFVKKIKRRILTIATDVTLDPRLLESLLKNCTYAIGSFLLQDSEVQTAIEKNRLARITCIARDFDRQQCITWLDVSKFPLTTKESVELLQTVSVLPSATMLLPIIIEHLTNALNLDLQVNPPIFSELTQLMQKLLASVSAGVATMVVKATNQYFIQSQAILNFADLAPEFAPVAEALLSVQVVCGYLVDEMLDADQQKYLSSNQFQPWLQLSPSSVTTLVNANEGIKKAIIARADFARMVIATTPDERLACILVKQSDLSLFDLTSLFANTTLKPKVINSLVEKAKKTLAENDPIQEIIRFLLALSHIEAILQEDAMEIVALLKKNLQALFNNRELRETFWVRKFAEYYAVHPEEMNESQNEEEWAFILLAHINTGKGQFNPDLLSAKTALLMLNNPSLDDKQYQKVLDWLQQFEKLYTPIFVCYILALACQSLERARIICQKLPGPLSHIYLALSQFDYTEEPNAGYAKKEMALKHLLVGTALADDSLARLKSLYGFGVRGYLLQINEDGCSTEKILTILQKSNVTFTLAEIILVLKMNPNLPVRLFKMLQHHYEAFDYLYLVAAYPMINVDLTEYLLECYCQHYASYPTFEFYETTTHSLKRLFSVSRIEEVIVQLFQSSYFSKKMNNNAEIICISIEEYKQLSACASVKSAEKSSLIRYAQSDRTVIVATSWFAYASAKLQGLNNQLTEIRERGELREKLEETDMRSQTAIVAEPAALVPLVPAP